MLSTQDISADRTTEDLLFDMADKACVRAWEDEGWGPVHIRLLTTAIKVENFSGFRKTSGMTQNEKIIDHIKCNGSISQREALLDHSIQSLTKRISELREEGWNIERVMKKHKVTGQVYARYYLPSTAARAKAAA